jgi:hypothetical protein
LAELKTHEAPNLGTAPVTNVRDLKSPYWRGWLKAEWRSRTRNLLLRIDRKPAEGNV